MNYFKYLAVLAAFVVVLTGVQSVPSATAASFPSATGGGETAANEHYSFSAHAGPDGPSGYARIKFPNFTVQGHVTCYTVLAPNIARFGIQVEKASGTDPRLPPANQGFVFYVEDNGTPGRAGPDIIGTGFVPTPPTDCASIGQFGVTPITRGNIVVKN